MKPSKICFSLFPSFSLFQNCDIVFFSMLWKTGRIWKTTTGKGEREREDHISKLQNSFWLFPEASRIVMLQNLQFQSNIWCLFLPSFDFCFCFMSNFKFLSLKFSRLERFLIFCSSLQKMKTFSFFDNVIIYYSFI